MGEINVSLNGKHLFATHERSIQSEYQFKSVLEIFNVKFPESEGYKITACYWEGLSKEIDIAKFL